MNCPLCNSALADLKTKTVTVCRRCGVVVDNFPEGSLKAIHPPVGYEIPPAREEILQGDIHYCLDTGKWDLDYPINEEFTLTDLYPLIARPARKREPGSGEQLTMF